MTTKDSGRTRGQLGTAAAWRSHITWDSTWQFVHSNPPLTRKESPMSVTRDFDAAYREMAGAKPTFTIAGQTFTLRAKIPQASFHKLIAVMRSDDVDAEEANRQFFQKALIKADRERFATLLDSEDDDDDVVIGLSQLNDLTDWAMEHFTGKPQSSSPGSTPGSNGTGESRNVVSLSARNAAS